MHTQSILCSTSDKCFAFSALTLLVRRQEEHPFNGLFSRTTSVSRYQKGKTSLDLNEARDDGVFVRQWHQLDHMQTICTSLQTGKPHQHLMTQIFTGWMHFLMPSEQCQSTEGFVK